MTTPDRFGFTTELHAETKVENGQEKHFEFALGTATRWAHKVASGLGATRQWIESEAIGDRPLITLGLAFGLGVFTGWLVKRR